MIKTAMTQGYVEQALAMGVDPSELYKQARAAHVALDVASGKSESLLDKGWSALKSLPDTAQQAWDDPDGRNAIYDAGLGLAGGGLLGAITGDWRNALIGAGLGAASSGAYNYYNWNKKHR